MHQVLERPKRGIPPRDVAPQTFNILRVNTRVIRICEIDRVIDLLVNEALV